MNTESNSCAECERLHVEMDEKDLKILSLLDKIDQLTKVDSLTGIYNRRTMIEMLEAELVRANRTGHPFCFVVLDLDHFKGINEKYGHAVGDTVLKAVSDTATKLLRALDRFGRFGSEEFAIILPATWLDQGMIAMNRLANTVSEYDWKNIIPGLTLTFSAGIATNAPGDKAETITKRAEKALYQAKNEGGNRTVQADEFIPGMPPA